MRILAIMDPLEKLQVPYDSTLYLIKEFYRRGYETWFADTPDIFSEGENILSAAKFIRPRNFPKGADHVKSGHKYSIGRPVIQDLRSFDLILLRKEPPFDMNYIYLTYLLEKVSGDVFISNSPRGIRNTNEKLGCLIFSHWMPETIMTSNVERIVEFQKRIDRDLVVKPLDQKGGIGVHRIINGDKNISKTLRQWTKNGTQMIAAQEFVTSGEKAKDKRITLLDGEVFWSFEKRAAGKEFRTNLDQGGKAFLVPITSQEKALIKEIRPYLKAEGLHLVGLDLIEGKLIDFNVTCPGGFSYAIPLHSNHHLVSAWADFLEKKVSQF